MPFCEKLFLSEKFQLQFQKCYYLGKKKIKIELGNNPLFKTLVLVSSKKQNEKFIRFAAKTFFSEKKLNFNFQNQGYLKKT